LLNFIEHATELTLVGTVSLYMIYDIEDKVLAADSNCIITFENIVNAVSKLKPGQHDGH